ncbi:MAG TPA: lysine 5,6-aminomutase subunit alpha, partial [Mycobacteriales bacterium]
MAPRLELDPATVAEARALARRAGEPVVALARTHTTTSVERAVLRFAGVTGADAEGIPWVNRLADVVREQVGLEHGVALAVHDALLRGEAADLTELAQKAGAGSVSFRLPAGADRDRAREAARTAAAVGVAALDRRRAERERLVAEIGDAPRRPWIYLIVATGNIHEDIPQARAAARAGADVIAVIRSTGQSLLDYVPEGATTEGYAGTYATGENFRLMRAALDEVSRELGRYVRLTNYA